jgi:hypothetical protein
VKKDDIVVFIDHLFPMKMSFLFLIKVRKILKNFNCNIVLHFVDRVNMIHDITNRLFKYNLLKYFDKVCTYETHDSEKYNFNLVDFSFADIRKKYEKPTPPHM